LTIRSNVESPEFFKPVSYQGIPIRTALPTLLAILTGLAAMEIGNESEVDGWPGRMIGDKRDYTHLAWRGHLGVMAC